MKVNNSHIMACTYW